MARPAPSLESRCGDGQTQPAPHVTPTPIPLDLNGAWAGMITFPSDCFSTSTCRSREEIQVTLSHVGDTVTGHFSTECLGNLELRGTLTGDQLTFDFSPLSGTGSFRGSATSTSIRVEKNCDPWGYGSDHTMRIDLAR
jgi:hypothetical protein